MSLANKDFAINQVKVFPEEIPITSAIATLPSGNTDMIRIWKNTSKSKVIKGLQFGIDAVDNVNLTQRIDNQAMPQLHSNSLPGLYYPYDVADVHEYYWARDQVLFQLSNNTGSNVSNYRTWTRILVDDLDSASKIMMGIPLDTRDNEAIANVKKYLGIDIHEKITLGVGLPSQFSQFLAEHEVIPLPPKPYLPLRSTPHGTNLSAVDYYLLDDDVLNKGNEAWVIENLYFPNGGASDIGNVTITINRDDDIDYIQLDPACLPENSNFNASITGFPLHIHAFDHLQIKITQNGGTHNDYQASVGLSRRKLGVAFKAKVLEFGHSLPKEVDITPAEQKVIDDYHIMDLIRTGLYPVG